MQKTIIKPTFWGYELNTATESSAFPIWLTMSPRWYLTANPHGHGQFPVHLHNHCEASQLSPAAVAEALPFRNLKQWTECRITIVHQTSHREWETQMNSLFCEGREAEGGSSTVQPRFLFWREFWKVVPHTEVMDAFGYRKWNFTWISHSDSAKVPKTTGMMARQEMAHQNI